MAHVRRSTGSSLRRYSAYVALALTMLVAILTFAHYPRQVDAVGSHNPALDDPAYQAFYGKNYYGFGPAAPPVQEKAPPADDYAQGIAAFVKRYGLEKGRVLEVGAGRGSYQDIVENYVALEISEELRRHFRKPFVAASATAMPFNDGEFDAIWTINVLEHIPKPEQALVEMRRVLKDGGLLYLQAAWQCRSWAAEGYQVRPYADFDVKGKLIKASIPLRDSVAYRALYTFPIRLIRLGAHSVRDEPTEFRYNQLSPNYKTFWQPDSDAVNSIDPYEAVLWFQSRGDEILSYQGVLNAFFVSTGTIIIRINKREK